MRTRVPDRALVTAVVALSCASLGCPSTALFRTAEPVAAGRWQITLAGAGGVLGDRETGAGSATGFGELGLRRGLTDNADVGVKLYTFGLAANTTLRFFHRGAWSISVAPELSFARTPRNATTTNAAHLFGVVTIPVTWRASRTWALSLGPSLGGGGYFPEAGGSAGGFWTGAFASVEARLGERWWLVAEVNGYDVVAGDVPLRGGLITGGLGLRFGF
jgi:hypothetical protein